MTTRPKAGKPGAAPPAALSGALAAFQTGRLGEAEETCRRALAVQPDRFDALHLLGIVLLSQGKGEEALACLDSALSARPDDVEALVSRGAALRRLRRPVEALPCFEQALAARPDHAAARFNHAITLQELNRHAEALASHNSALALRVDNPAVWTNRGIALHALNRFDEALASYDHALALRPNHAEALNNRGATLHALGRIDEALACFARAVAAQPEYAKAYLNRAAALQDVRRYDDAVASYDHALRLQPANPDIWASRGAALNDLRRFGEALACFDRALSLRPDDADSHNNQGISLSGLRRHNDALASFGRAIALRPDHVAAFVNRAKLLADRGRLAEALVSYERALDIQPANSLALTGVADYAARLCDFKRRTRLLAAMPEHIAGNGFVGPFALLGYSDDAALQRRSAALYADYRIGVPPAPVWTGEKWRHPKLRIAYLSSDFRAHAIACLITELFETHDRGQFEISGISFGDDDGSAPRKRLVAAFDSFDDVLGIDDKAVAELLHRREIDIAVDLQGYVGDDRPAILAYRPAPIQASYLGYPATLGTYFADYLIADRIVAPYEYGQFYSERIVHLPDCYQANDRRRRPAERVPTRQEVGLPQHSFVFCCFNNNWKITPAIFDVWIRLLRQVRGSVMWLLGDNEGAKRHLRYEADRRNINPARLIFAPRVDNATHLARHNLADLFLDTLPCNAHTTASDALRMGLPLLTCIGQTFAARVAASLLHTVGLPELVVTDLAAYEALALTLARDPAMLAAMREKLRRNLDTGPLLDTPRFTRNIEAAYRTMWEIWQRGEPPRSFAVTADGNARMTETVEPSP
jgi:predicted O-linked N-acetylglucosamine transferase (SPINDLY family)